jgi:hypothetical protein
MPLYYFNIYNDDITMDEEGQDLPDAEAARTEAIKSARDIICDGVREGEVTLSHRIEIEDEEHRPVLTVRFDEALSVNP